MKSGCEGAEKNQKKRKDLPVLPNEVKKKPSMGDSRVSRWRAAALILLNLLMAAHIVQWKLSGSTVTPIEPSEAMHTLQTGGINAGFIFFGLAILATLIFGRFICGWGCHVLALQDLCAWILLKLGLRPRPFRSRLLIYIPLIFALYMFVWPTVARWIAKPPAEPLFPNFTNHIITTDFWATFPTVWVAIPFLFVCGFATVYFLGTKGFCTYGCPYGGFFVLADKVAPGKIRVTDACNSCGHCTAVCTSNVIVHQEVKDHGMVVDPGCMKCMDCVSVCPNDALYFGFGKPAVTAEKKGSRNFSLTWTEELIAIMAFILSFFAVWDVYQLVPMLMAIGIAIVTTFIVIKLTKLFTEDSQSFYRFSFKSKGTIKPAGIAFIVFAAFCIALTAHSGFIRYNERNGAIAFQKLTLPDELVLAQSDPTQWVNVAERENVSTGKEYFERAFSTALFTNKEALSKYAWIEYLSGNKEQALELLQRSIDVQSGQGKALSAYYRGAILNRNKRNEEALKDLETALSERPDLITAREEKGEALWQLGRKDEAIEVWKDVADENPRLPITNNMLVSALRSTGRSAEAAKYAAQAEQFTPNDGLFYWMLGLRLEGLGMTERAELLFGRAIQLNPQLKNVKR